MRSVASCEISLAESCCLIASMRLAEGYCSALASCSSVKAEECWVLLAVVGGSLPTLTLWLHTMAVWARQE